MNTVEKIFNLAIKNHQEDKTDIALELYNQVLKINPNHSLTLNNIAVIFTNSKDYQKAISCFEKVIKINPNYSATHNNLGNIFQKLGDLQKAKDCYEKAIKINPNYVDAYYNLGVISKELGEDQKTISCFEKAIEIDPNFAHAHNNLGNVFKDSGNPQKAISYYEKAIEIDPKHIDAHYNLGIALIMTQQYKNATEHFKLINYKNSKSFLLQCLYKIEDKSIFFKELDYLIKQGENNPLIGSLISRSEIRYKIKKLNPFCGDPLKYILITNLTEEYNFKNIFVEPIKSALKEDMFSTKAQGLLKNGYQTAGNIFAKKNDFFDKIKDIIHLQIKKYQDLFKESNEGLIKNWPKSYDIYAWLVNMKTGGKLAPHIHEFGWLSGSIYINVPPKLEADSGNLVVCINDQMSESENKINPKKTIDVVTGSLCLFPSSLYHYTIPFESNEERIVLAFDVKPNYLK